MALACVSIGIAVASPAAAFKPETHVWLAEQIIIDLKKPGGNLTILVDPPAGRTRRQRKPATRRFTVPPSVRSAILNNPEAFRLGAIGPDAFPGIIEGQTTIHPGQGGWGTGEWLSHVLRQARTPEEISFAYGMLTHAAGDIWAHSYINHYAGNAFDLRDGEVTVEARHVLLEGYIATRTPWHLAGGSSTGTAASRLLVRGNSIAVPREFLFRVFVESPDAAAAFKEGGSPQMHAVHALYGKLGDIARDGGITDDLHKTIQKAVVFWLTDYNIKSSELEALNRIHQQLLDGTNKTIDDLQRGHDQLRAANREWMGQRFALTEDALKIASDGIAALTDLNTRKQSIERELLDLHADLESKLGLPDIRRALPCTPIRSWLGGLLGHDCKDEIFTNPALVAAREALAAKRQLERETLNQISDAQTRVHNALGAAHATMLTAYDAHTTFLRASIDFGQRFNANENPIKGAILAWRSDVRQSMLDYFDANIQAIDASMTGGNMLDPLKRWLGCSALKIVAVPGQAMDVVCAAKDTFANLQTLLTTIKRVDPVSNEIADLQEKLLGEVIKVARDPALNFAGSVTGVDIATFADAVS